MDILSEFARFDPLDLVAVGFLLLGWWAIGWLIEHPTRRYPSVTMLMAGYRRIWMREFVNREARIFDATILASLRQGTAFFASTSILAIGGVLALIGNTEPLRGVAAGITQDDAPALVWQGKLLLVALILTHAFLKFVWANRVFGYCAVMMAAVPNDPADPVAQPRAAQAAELNIRAAMNFNRGLRSMYFALGALAWLLGPVPLMVATAAVVAVLWTRDFASVPYDILSEGAAPPTTPRRDVD
jgi:uncharacterized membrane protein